MSVPWRRRNVSGSSVERGDVGAWVSSDARQWSLRAPACRDLGQQTSLRPHDPLGGHTTLSMALHNPCQTTHAPRHGPQPGGAGATRFCAIATRAFGRKGNVLRRFSAITFASDLRSRSIFLSCPREVNGCKRDARKMQKNGDMDFMTVKKGISCLQLQPRKRIYEYEFVNIHMWVSTYVWLLFSSC